MKPIQTAVCMLLLAAPAGASAAEFYFQYQTETGTLSFTDDLRRVPEKYRAEAKRLESHGLFDYDRASLSKKGASIASAKSIFDSGPLDPRAVRKSDGFDWSYASRGLDAQRLPSYDLEIEDRVYLGIQGGEGPIRVDRNEYVVRDGVTSTRTVVRQGGRDLVYIEDRAPYLSDPTESMSGDER